DLLVADQVAVCHGGVSRLGGYDHLGHRLAQRLGQDAAQGIVGASRAAGGNDEELLLLRDRRPRKDEGQRQDDGYDEECSLLHPKTLLIKMLAEIPDRMPAVAPVDGRSRDRLCSRDRTAASGRWT